MIDIFTLHLTHYIYRATKKTTISLYECFFYNVDSLIRPFHKKTIQ